jgi:hypothetical protein
MIVIFHDRDAKHNYGYRDYKDRNHFHGFRISWFDMIGKDKISLSQR